MFKQAYVGEIRGPGRGSWAGKATGGMWYAIYSHNGWWYANGPEKDWKKTRQEACRRAMEIMMMDSLNLIG